MTEQEKQTWRRYYAAAALQGLIAHYGHEILGGDTPDLEVASLEIAESMIAKEKA